MNSKKVRIGGASGFWGDSSLGAPQLVRLGNIDYLVFDYLAELTMSILAGARLKDRNAGYATDFVSVAMRAVLPMVVAKGIKVISNAGGVNPKGCALALETLAAELGLSVRIAVVEGDDVMPLIPELRAAGIAEMSSGDPLPDKLVTANAYLGAIPIAEALGRRAQIVVTGRCVDSAVTLGALIHEFGWKPDEFDRLAAGSLAGHIIECGCQATGGLHTDWEKVPDWANIGYPIIEVEEDGTFVIEKPPGTGGLIDRFSVGEQLLYEIGDPACYLLPDVVCDFRQVHLQQVGENRVRVSGARGRAPTPHYKVSATYMAGFRLSAQLVIIGMDAARKAQRTGEALIERARKIFKELSLVDFAATNLELLGNESAYGPLGGVSGVREVVLRLSVRHDDKRALELFSRELAAPGTSFAPGTTGSAGRPSVSPVLKQFAFLLEKNRIAPTLTLGTESIRIPQADQYEQTEPVPLESVGAVEYLEEVTSEVPLLRIAYGRSGDKGDTSNIGLIARRPEWLGVLRAEVTSERVAGYLSHLVKGPVRRFDVPGIDAINLVCENALGGGGVASLRVDPLGKGMAQILLGMPIRLPNKFL